MSLHPTAEGDMGPKACRFTLGGDVTLTSVIRDGTKDERDIRGFVSDLRSQSRGSLALSFSTLTRRCVRSTSRMTRVYVRAFPGPILWRMASVPSTAGF
jgi:hypothetical protein